MMRTSSRSSRGGGLGTGVKKTTQVISGASGLRHSLRSSGSGKIWKKTVLGKKFEFGERLKEKKNYVMYHSGMGHEKNVIEEFEKIPEQEKIIQEKQLIDNYGYHESKDLKKKKDPTKISITRHQRLSSPFERTIVKKFGQTTTVPQETRVYTSTTKKSNKLGGGGTDVLSKYSSFTSKQEKNVTVAPTNLFETYKPSKPSKPPKQTKASKTTTSYTKTVTTKTRAPVTTTIKEYSSKTITKPGKPTLKTSKYVSSSNISKYLPKYEPKSLNFETEQNRFGDTQTKTETTQDGDYLIKITTSKKKIGEDYGSSNYSSSSVPRSTYLESLSSVTKTIERPSFNFPSSIGISKQYETKEKRTKTFVDLGKKPETFTFSEYKTSGPSLGGPLSRSTFGVSRGYVPKPALKPVSGLGPRPTLGSRPGNESFSHGTYEIMSYKKEYPLFEGNLHEYKSESQTNGNKGHDNNTFSHVKKVYSEVRNYSSSGSRNRIGESSFNLGRSANKKSSKPGVGLTKYSISKTITTTTGSRNKRNYNNLDVKKKKKKPITTMQIPRHGIIGQSRITSVISKSHQRSSSHKPKGYSSTNLTSGLSSIGNNFKNSYILISNKTKKSGNTSGLGKTSSLNEYKRYEQRGNKGRLSSNDYRRKGSSDENSRYQYKREIAQREPDYRENEENYEHTHTYSNEYNRYRDGEGDFSSQYQYRDGNEYEVVYCPVHGKQIIKKRRNVNHN